MLIPAAIAFAGYWTNLAIKNKDVGVQLIGFGDEEHLRIYDEEQYVDLSSHDL